MSLSLVSCIMPTANRRRFVPEAIRMFLAQDYPEKELLILDDGEDSVIDLIPSHPEIRYLRYHHRQPLGVKRNLACDEARGEIIAHWDDDDWYSPSRLRYQVGELLASEADLSGIDRVLFLDPRSRRAWEYVYPPGGSPWVCGATLCYRKSVWHRSRFPEVNVGEDTRFVANMRGSRIKVHSKNGFFIGVNHSANTSPKHTHDSLWKPQPLGTIVALMGPDWPFYRSIYRVDEPLRAENTQTRLPPITDRPTALATAIPTAAREHRVATHRRETNTVMKLNIGCCDALLEGFVNVDLVPASGVQVADLRNLWPWGDSSIDYVRAWDIIEHLPDKIFTMNEIWRVLRSEGQAEIAVPTTDGSGAFQDPTHVSFWNRRSFLYYESGNPYRERFAANYGIRAKFRTAFERIDQTPDGPRLLIILQAVKP